MQQDEALRSTKVGNIMFTFLARIDKKQVCGLEGVGKKEDVLRGSAPPFFF